MNAQPVRLINTATLIIGPTGSGKSSQLYTIARRVWKTYRMISRLYSCDGGAFPTWIQKAITQGILQVWRMRTRSDKDLAFETLYRATQGWWPRKIDPRTGATEPAVELVPPVTQLYKVSCTQQHHLVSVRTAQEVGELGLLHCSVCNRQYGPDEQVVERTTFQTPGFEQVGAVFFDSLSSMQKWQLNDLGHRFGRLELKGEEAAIGGKVHSGDLSFGGTTRSHIGFAQTRAEELVANAIGIPGLVESPVFTALTMEMIEEGAVRICGPKLAGKAITDESPSYFGNVVETAVVPDESGTGLMKRRLYLSEFVDDDGVKHLLKNAAGTLPAYLDDPPMDPKNPDTSKYFTGCSMANFFDLLDAAVTHELEQPDVELGETPGLPLGEVEVGVGEAQAVTTKVLTAASIARPSRAVAAVAKAVGAAVNAPVPVMAPRPTSSGPTGAVSTTAAIPPVVSRAGSTAPIQPAAPPAPTALPPTAPLPPPTSRTPQAVAPQTAAGPTNGPRAVGGPPSVPGAPTPAPIVPRPRARKSQSTTQ